MLDDGAQRDGGGQAQGIAIDACAERGEGDTCNLVPLGKVEAALVGALQEPFVFRAAAIDWPDGVKNILRGESSSRRCHSASRWTAADCAAFLHDARAAGAVNGAIDAAAARERAVGGIDDGICLRFNDVSLEQYQGNTIDCAC